MHPLSDDKILPITVVILTLLVPFQGFGTTTDILPASANFALYIWCLRSYTHQRRRGRVVEGTPLLRAHTGNGIEGSNPFVSAKFLAEVIDFEILNE